VKRSSGQPSALSPTLPVTSAKVKRFPAAVKSDLLTYVHHAVLLLINEVSIVTKAETEKISQYLRSHWPLSEIAAILDDAREPTTFRSLQSWVTGQVLRIKPSLVVPGQKRKRYGLSNLLDFLIAKQLLHVAGFPAHAVQVFIDHFRERDFLNNVTFPDKMDGYFILLQDGPKDAKSLFFNDEQRFYTGVLILARASNIPKWTTLHLRGLFLEALARLDCWNRRVEYRPITAGEYVKKALSAVREQKEEVHK